MLIGGHNIITYTITSLYHNFSHPCPPPPLPTSPIYILQSVCSSGLLVGDTRSYLLPLLLRRRAFMALKIRRDFRRG